jgi:hypothetical protein
MTSFQKITSLYGIDEEQMSSVLSNVNPASWLSDEEGQLTDHLSVVDPSSYETGNDSAHPGFQITSFLLNRRLHRARSIFVHDRSGMTGENFIETLANYAMTNPSYVKDLSRALSDDRAITNISNVMTTQRGLKQANKMHATLPVIEYIQDAWKFEDLKILSPIQTILLTIFDDNGYVHEHEDMRKVVVDSTVAISATQFEASYAAYHLSKKFGTVSTDLKEANLTSDHHRIVSSSILKSELTVKLAMVAAILREAVSYKNHLNSALFYIAKMAKGEKEVVPLAARTTAETLGQYWNLVEFATKVHPTTVSPKEWEAEHMMAQLFEFVENSEMIEVRRVADIASFVQVDVTRDPHDRDIEQVLLTTKRARANKREVYYNSGQLAGFDKLFVEKPVQEATDALFAADAAILPQGLVKDRFLDAIAQLDNGAGVVYNFTSTDPLDRKMFAAAVALQRTKRVNMAYKTPTIQGPNAEVELVYYVRPTEIIAGIETERNRIDEFRTTDPHVVIALTGGQNSTKELPGYDTTLHLDPSRLNMVDLTSYDYTIELDKPLYKATIEATKEGKPVTFSNTPLDLLNLKELDNVYATYSASNRDDDRLTVRMMMMTWAALDIAALDSNYKAGVEAFRSTVARVILEHWVDSTLHNPAAQVATDVLVRQYANGQKVYRNFGRFYADERVMLNVRMYIAAMQYCHFLGLTVDEVKAINQIVVDSDALTRSLGSIALGKLSTNSTRT